MSEKKVRLLISKVIGGSVYPKLTIMPVPEKIAEQWIAANEAEAVTDEQPAAFQASDSSAQHEPSGYGAKRTRHARGSAATASEEEQDDKK